VFAHALAREFVAKLWGACVLFIVLQKLAHPLYGDMTIQVRLRHATPRLRRKR
jgi:hypothetical protein